MKYLNVILLIIFTVSIQAQTTEFTFQGKLNESGAPVSSPRDLRFRLWNAESAGTQVGPDVTVVNAGFAAGVFSVRLDFGEAAFNGDPVWIEIAVSQPGVGTYTTLQPRQALGSAPYAIKSLSSVMAESADVATTAENSNALGGIPANQYVQTADPRLSDARDPLPGSASYIQNQNANQQTANFNLNGTGRAWTFDAATQFTINGNHALSMPGAANLFAGPGAGQSNVSGLSNSFFGEFAGTTNNTGNRNSFFGFHAGQKNNNGEDNSFFGVQAGRENVGGNGNTFAGRLAGFINTSGNNNAFFGFGAGGTTTGSNNTAIGAQTSVGSNTRMFGTAIGSYATVSADDTIVLGKTAGTYDGIARPADTVIVPGTLNVAGTFEANVLSATTQFNIGVDQVLSAAGNQNLFVGVNAGQNNTGQGNTFVGRGAGRFNTTASNNSFFGRGAGVANTTGPNNSFFGNLAGTSNTTGASNSFFGNVAGGSNTTGQANAFFGANSGQTNQTGGLNSFFGFNAGLVNETGGSNAFFGHDSGSANITGQRNTFIGGASGLGNSLGNSLTLVGNQSNVSADGLQFATAIGANAAVGSSDTIVIGKLAGTYGGVARPADTVAVPGIFNTDTQYNLGGSRILSSGPNSVSVGALTGTQGQFNTFVGVFAGNKTTGNDNVFVGNLAGLENLSATANTFVGSQAGRKTTTGNSNSMFGMFAGNDNTTGGANVFFGSNAGSRNTGGSSNTFVGSDANFSSANATGSGNTLLGRLASVAPGVNDATAIGTGAQVTQDNTIVLGRPSDTVQVPGSLTTGFFAANILNATSQFMIDGGPALSFGSPGFNLHVGGSSPSSTGTGNSFVGRFAGFGNTSGNYNTYFGLDAGRQGTTGGGNSAFGKNAARSAFVGNDNTFIGQHADFANVANPTGNGNSLFGTFTTVNSGVNNSSAVGNRAYVTQSNSLVLGSINGINGATSDTSVGVGTTAPKARLEVAKGDLLIGSPGQGIILKSATGNTCAKLTIDDTPTFVGTIVPCP